MHKFPSSHMIWNLWVQDCNSSCSHKIHIVCTRWYLAQLPSWSIECRWDPRSIDSDVFHKICDLWEQVPHSQKIDILGIQYVKCTSFYHVLVRSVSCVHKIQILQEHDCISSFSHKIHILSAQVQVSCIYMMIYCM